MHLADFFPGVFFDPHYPSCAPVAEAFHDRGPFSGIQAEKEFARIYLHSAPAGQYFPVKDHKDGFAPGDGA
ncbi:hypothetical protein Defa_23040 [Desulfovibrio sp. TH_2024_36128]|uniref:Uncharacterized protein n=1 Tax=Desulfovibrio falkowii TaxID=3136602 RepID=A0ABQ0EAY9_9BACT